MTAQLIAPAVTVFLAIAAGTAQGWWVIHNIRIDRHRKEKP